MKKSLFTSLAALTLFSCSEQVEINDSLLINNTEQTSNVRSVSEAIHIADIVSRSSSIGSRSSIKPKYSVHIIQSDISRSSYGDTLLYAVDYENDGGFVLIAAPKSVDPIMAIIDQGSFDDPENLENEAYQETLDAIKSSIASRIKLPYEPIERDTTKLPLIPSFYYDTIDIQTIHEPALEVAWSQVYPQNIYAPNKLAGCIPVAIGQLFTYLQPSLNINYTFPERDITGEVINWAALMKHKRSMSSLTVSGNHCVDCSVNDGSHNTIGRIIRQFGHDVDANYGYYPTPYGNEPVTSAYSSTIEPTIRKYTSTNPVKYGSTLSSLYNSLCSYGGVAIMGSRYEDDLVGHCWLADGVQYIDYRLIRYDYVSTIDQPGKYTPVVVKSIQKQFIHYNWGDGGVCNGWFNINAIEVGNAVEYDYDDVSNISYDTYNTNSNLLFWIYKK